MKFFPLEIKKAQREADKRKLKLRAMFQDESRFGRITDPKRCWAPEGKRPVVPKQIIREYTYTYGAYSPKDGVMDSLILPNMHSSTMSIFLAEVSKRHPDEYILMVVDGASNHRSKDLKIPSNIQLLSLPPYSPKLNPAENMWDEIKEKFFKNTVFKDMDGVDSRLTTALRFYESHPKIVKNITGWNWITKFL